MQISIQFDRFAQNSRQIFVKLTVKPLDWAQTFPSCPQITAWVTILVAISWSSTYACQLIVSEFVWFAGEEKGFFDLFPNWVDGELGAISWLLSVWRVFWSKIFRVVTLNSKTTAADYWFFELPLSQRLAASKPKKLVKKRQICYCLHF